MKAQIGFIALILLLSQTSWGWQGSLTGSIQYSRKSPFRITSLDFQIGEKGVRYKAGGLPSDHPQLFVIKKEQNGQAYFMTHKSSLKDRLELSHTIFQHLQDEDIFKEESGVRTIIEKYKIAFILENLHVNGQLSCHQKVKDIPFIPWFNTIESTRCELNLVVFSEDRVIKEDVVSDLMHFLPQAAVKNVRVLK